VPPSQHTSTPVTPGTSPYAAFRNPLSPDAPSAPGAMQPRSQDGYGTPCQGYSGQLSGPSVPGGVPAGTPISPGSQSGFDHGLSTSRSMSQIQGQVELPRFGNEAPKDGVRRQQAAGNVERPKPGSVESIISDFCLAMAQDVGASRHYLDQPLPAMTPSHGLGGGTGKHGASMTSLPASSQSVRSPRGSRRGSLLEGAWGSAPSLKAKALAAAGSRSVVSRWGSREGGGRALSAEPRTSSWETSLESARSSLTLRSESVRNLGSATSWKQYKNAASRTKLQQQQVATRMDISGDKGSLTNSWISSARRRTRPLSARSFEGEPRRIVRHKLQVCIIEANSLRHLNHFTGDHMYCVCEVRCDHEHRASASSTRFETSAVTGTLEPVWDEIHEIESWFEGEALEFRVLDKGLLGSRAEGKALLRSEDFFPNGFEGGIPLEGLPGSLLHVRVALVPRSMPSDSAEKQAADANVSLGALAAAAFGNTPACPEHDSPQSKSRAEPLQAEPTLSQTASVRGAAQGAALAAAAAAAAAVAAATASQKGSMRPYRGGAGAGTSSPSGSARNMQATSQSQSQSSFKISANAQQVGGGSALQASQGRGAAAAGPARQRLSTGRGRGHSGGRGQATTKAAGATPSDPAFKVRVHPPGQPTSEGAAGAELKPDHRGSMVLVGPNNFQSSTSPSAEPADAAAGSSVRSPGGSGSRSAARQEDTVETLPMTENETL